MLLERVPFAFAASEELVPSLGSVEAVTPVVEEPIAYYLLFLVLPLVVCFCVEAQANTKFTLFGGWGVWCLGTVVKEWKRHNVLDIIIICDTQVIKKKRWETMNEATMEIEKDE